MWAAREKRASAIEELQHARQIDKRNLVAGFIENAPRAKEEASAVQAKIDAADGDIEHFTEVQTAARSELEAAERRLARLRVDKHAAIAAFVVASPEFTGLLDAIDRAWAHLRSLRICADLVLEATHGNMSASLMSTMQRSEPLVANIVGYQVEESLIRAWRDGLAAVFTDADANLNVQLGE